MLTIIIMAILLFCAVCGGIYLQACVDEKEDYVKEATTMRQAG